MHSARYLVAGALLLGLGGLFGIGNARAGEGPPEARSTRSALTRIGAARAESDNYTVELKPASSYKIGAGSSFEVIITSRGGYHINPQFPIRFKTNKAPDNVAYDKDVLKREDGHFEESTGGFKVGFSASKAGSYNVGGTLSLSICSEKNCLMEKVAVDTDVIVK